MKKKEIRQKYRELRKELSDPALEKLQDLLLIRFQQLQLPFLNYVHVYLPMDHHREPDTFHLVEYLKFRNPGINIVIPKTDFKKNLFENILYTDETELVKNEYNILEPANGERIDADLMDLILVPLLAFDRSGNRVGYGKGFYDRFLSTCRADALKVGISFFEPLDHIDDTDDFDIPLTHCVTPERIYEF
ncbi:MAG: 5-formyltetrahydrofolate cyclo-ligase [Bacteroidetes bacterium]|nr:MAG: 5-formyltetrahydrofolate cyclo-ligase [Bacteroidota bacterium]